MAQSYSEFIQELKDLRNGIRECCEKCSERESCLISILMEAGQFSKKELKQILKNCTRKTSRRTCNTTF